jgi:ribulose-phosphate 3-epimerase
MEREVIPIASDHPAFELKSELITYLNEIGFKPLDLGTYSKERVDYPIYALSVADKVSKGQYKRGIVICKTGVGVSIVANKFPKIRAGLITNKETAELTRKHNDTNILALGSGCTSVADAKQIVKTWLETEPEGGRHQGRIDQISIIEKNNLLQANNEHSQMLFSAMMNETQGSEAKISASLMCANQLQMTEDIDALLDAGIDQFHIDIIDGVFAPNVSLNVDHVSALRKKVSLPIDVHLMVKDPMPYIPRLYEAGANIVIVHVESVDVNSALEDIRTHGMKAGLAIEVDTPLEKLDPYLDKVSVVMFMAVKTGFKGSNYVPEVQDKIKQFSEKKLPITVMVDGSLGPRTIPHLYKAGARIFVGGTSGLFKAGSYKDNIKQMKSFCY